MTFCYISSGFGQEAITADQLWNSFVKFNSGETSSKASLDFDGEALKSLLESNPRPNNMRGQGRGPHYGDI